MTHTARIVILIAAHNSERHLPETVASLRSGSVPVHIVIVDDASMIPVAEIIPATQNITVLRSEENIGLTRALNTGLAYIFKQNFDFIARLDADDLCCHNRFARQVSYLEAHPDVGLTGSWLRFIDENSKAVLRHYQPPEGHDEIVSQLPLNSCILHPTWFMRAATARALYPYSEDYPAAEDYDFLMRAARRFRLANVPEFLVDARDTRGGISRQKRRLQLISRLRIQLRFFSLRNWRCWVGIAMTLLSLVLPYEFILWLKNQRG